MVKAVVANVLMPSLFSLLHACRPSQVDGTFMMSLDKSNPGSRTRQSLWKPEKLSVSQTGCREKVHEQPTVAGFEDFVGIPRVQRVAHDVDRSGNHRDNGKRKADHLCHCQLQKEA